MAVLDLILPMQHLKHWKERCSLALAGEAKLAFAQSLCFGARQNEVGHRGADTGNTGGITLLDRLR